MTEKPTPRRSRRPAKVEQLEGLIVLLDVEGDHLQKVLFDAVLPALEARHDVSAETRRHIGEVFQREIDFGAGELGHSVAIIHEKVATDCPPLQVLCRLAKPLPLIDRDGQHTQFLWVLLGSADTHPIVDAAAEFAALMDDDDFHRAAVAASSAEDLLDAYHDALDREVHFAAHIPSELQPTGRFAGGIIGDIRRRLPHYRSDFRDALSGKAFGAIVFLYFACLAPTLAFGVLAAELTEGAMGPVEMIAATAACGVVYGLFSGQPLTILGGIAPVVVLIQVIFQGCERLGVPFLPSLAWVGLWTMVFLLAIALFEGCALIRFFTRFTDDTFAALISLIFIVEALRPIFRGFSGDIAAAWMSLVLTTGTFYIAINLSRFRHSPYLRHGVREFLADFGPTIAIVLMTGLALYHGEVAVPTLKVPIEGISTTSGRPWLVNPFEAPRWVWFAAAGPALVVTILLYLDQNITVRLVNSADNRLKKGAGYHLDLAVVGVLVGISSLFGLPWMVAATVRSLNHVRSLASVVVDRDGKEQIASVCENRLTNVAVNILMGLTLLLLPLVSKIPLSVLFGLFLFMGVASMSGNQFFERLRLWLVDPRRYSPTYYLRAVPSRTVHRFTAVQLLCVVALWLIKVSVVSILFPVCIAGLVPVRMSLDRWFKQEHLALLDSAEMPEQEEDRFT